MMKLLSDDLEDYIWRHSQSPDPLFEELRKRTYDEMDAPQMQVGRVEGALLKLLVGITGATRVIEVGTFTGYSALSMAEALPDDGRLITLDRDEKATAVAQSFFDRSPHGKKIEIRLGDAMESVRALPQDSSFDIAFIDADKARYPAYYEELVPRLRSGGLFIADNTLWSGAVLDPKTDDAKGIAALNDKVTSDDRVHNVLLSVRDGIMLARKH